MNPFTDPELQYLRTQQLARIATASSSGQPDVSPVGFGVDDDALVSGGLDITKTVRYKNLLENPRATVVIDDLASIDPWSPRGVKVRGAASIESHEGGLRIRIVPEVIWSWGINEGQEKCFASVERRTVSRQQQRAGLARRLQG
jgi:pyridoxamine 5'-phosphate oxidase family protein